MESYFRNLVKRGIFLRLIFEFLGRLYRPLTVPPKHEIFFWYIPYWSTRQKKVQIRMRIFFSGIARIVARARKGTATQFEVR